MGCRPSREVHPSRESTSMSHTYSRPNSVSNLKEIKGRTTPSKLSNSTIVQNQNPAKQLQVAMETLPNFKAHWEKLIEQINIVSIYDSYDSYDYDSYF